MSIRSIILAAAIPLFILLAAVNGALLYYQSRAEMLHGLDQRALAAAVTTAEFLSEPAQPQAIVDDPQRHRALAAAVGHLPGLDGLYLVGRDGKSTALATPVRPWASMMKGAPSAPVVLPLAQGAEGNRYVAALAPVVDGVFVAARFDAEPLFARMEALQWWIVWGVGLAVLVGLATGLHVARRIQRELAVSQATIGALEAGEAPPQADGLAIAEAAELAGALRLVDANRRSARIRMHEQVAQADRDRSDAAAFEIYRQSAFAPLSTTRAGTAIVAHIYGAAPPGCFYAVCQGHGGGALVIGECQGVDALDALAAAVAARRFLERQWRILGPDHALELARQAFAISRLDYRTWEEAAPPEITMLLAIADPETARRAAIYAQADPDMPPDMLVGGIAALLEPVGLFAALRRS
jgi:hypothetical protein